MKRFLKPSAVLFVPVFSRVATKGPKSETTIRALRDASNQALKSYDHEKVLSFLTEDVLTTTGLGPC